MRLYLSVRGEIFGKLALVEIGLWRVGNPRV